MTQPDTLHARLRAELDRRLEVAASAAAQYGPCWLITHIPPYTDPVLLAGDGGDDLLSAGTVDLHETHQVHIALHDPADAVRRYTGELEVLQRHTEGRFNGPSAAMFGDGPWCRACRGNDWPCLDLILLAGRLGVSVDG